MEIACGRCTESPFPEDIVRRTRERMREVLSAAGHGDCQQRAGDQPQQFETRLIQGLLQACEDPDARFCEFWSRGVWLGSDERKLPRTPAIFDRERKWRLDFP